MANRIVLNPVSYHGAGAVKEIGGELSRRGYKRAFIACGRHVVKSGETLSSIARKRGTSIDRLCRLNNIKRNTILRPGQILRYS